MFQKIAFRLLAMSKCSTSCICTVLYLLLMPQLKVLTREVDTVVAVLTKLRFINDNIQLNTLEK